MTPSGGTSELPDFLEVGLDAETHFRRLKEHYIAVKEDQDGWCIVSWEVERISRIYLLNVSKNYLKCMYTV